MKLLEMRRLTVRVGRRVLLHPADLTLAPGEWKAIMGANGAGKSTMLKAIAGLMPREGKLFYRGDLVDKQTVAFRRELGVLFHESLLYGDMTASENLIFTARLWGLDNPRAVADEWLETVGLRIFSKERVATFSRGMVQRLALARALLIQPKLLLLDEPLASVDAQGQTEILGLFARAQAQGIAALWVTHTPEKARPLTGEPIEIYRGRLIKDDSNRGVEG